MISSSPTDNINLSLLRKFNDIVNYYLEKYVPDDKVKYFYKYIIYLM